MYSKHLSAKEKNGKFGAKCEKSQKAQLRKTKVKWNTTFGFRYQCKRVFLHVTNSNILKGFPAVEQYVSRGWITGYCQRTDAPIYNSATPTLQE